MKKKNTAEPVDQVTSLQHKWRSQSKSCWKLTSGHIWKRWAVSQASSLGKREAYRGNSKYKDLEGRGCRSVYRSMKGQREVGGWREEQ